MVNPPRVSLVIVNWNGKQFLEPCFVSLISQTYKDFGIILVDNGSEDGSVEFVREKYPDVKIIQNSKNLGFAEANNKGIAACKGEFVALLNNDTVAEKDWLQKLVAAAEKNSTDVAAFGSRMMVIDEMDIIESAGSRLLKDGGLRERYAGININEVNLKDEPVGGVGAGAALYRREALEGIKEGDDGYFDPSFFAYCEDVDMAYRLLWAGYSAMYVHNAVVYHHGSATGKRIGDLKIELGHLNRLRVMAKNFSNKMILQYLLDIAIRQIFEFFYSSVKYLSLAPIRARIKFLGEVLTLRKWHSKMKQKFGLNERNVIAWLGEDNYLDALMKRERKKF